MANDSEHPAVRVPSCTCGRYAVGYCVTCETPCCDKHGTTSEMRFLCRPHADAEKAERIAEAESNLVAAAAAIEEWLRAISEPEERLLAACLYFGNEVPKTAYDVNPSTLRWIASEVLRGAFPEWDSSPAENFFTPMFGITSSNKVPVPEEDDFGKWFRERMTRLGQPTTGRHTIRQFKTSWNGKRKEIAGRTVDGWHLENNFLLAEHAEQQVLTGELTVWDCRHMASLLELAAPPPSLLSSWQHAASAVRKIHAGLPTTGCELSDILRQHDRPATSSTTIATTQPGPARMPKHRIDVALRELESLSIAPSRRLVATRFRDSKDGVEVEPAWPISECTWSHPGPRGSDRYENLLTGVTRSGRIVPMTRATEGDSIDWRDSPWRRGVEFGSLRGVTLRPDDIATALEMIVARSRDNIRT